MDLTLEQREQYDKLLINLEKANPDKMFYPRFDFPSEECLKDFLKSANDKGITALGFSACEKFGARRTVWLMDNIDLIPDLKTLSLSDSEIGQRGAKAVCEKIPETKITHLSIERNDLPEKLAKPILEMVRKTPFTHLYLGHNFKLGSTFIEDLCPLLPEKPLKGLGLEALRTSQKTMETLARTLPQTQIMELNVSDLWLSDKRGVPAFAEALPQTQIKKLEIKSMMGSEGLVAIFKALPDTEITSFSTSVYERHSEEVLDEMVKAFKTPKCRIENAYIYTGRIKKPQVQEYYAARDTLKENVAYRKAIRFKAEKNKEAPVDPQMPLAEALENGLLSQALEKRPQLKADDCLTAGKDGLSLLDKAVRAEVLSVLFSAKNWNNAKEMQLAWNAVPQEHRWQMDGQRGRPSYQAEKNNVMKKSVSMMFAAKNKAKGNT